MLPTPVAGNPTEGLRSGATDANFGLTFLIFELISEVPCKEGLDVLLTLWSGTTVGLLSSASSLLPPPDESTVSYWSTLCNIMGGMILVVGHDGLYESCELSFGLRTSPM